MKNLEIKKLTEIIESAKTFTENGRQEVVESCKKLYNLIEEDFINVGSEWMLPGLYRDLCNGNFAEPFLCENKKTEFFTAVAIYEQRILPNL